MAEIVDGDPFQVEIELKLLTDERTAKRVWGHKSVKALLHSAPRTRHIRTAYYDTPGNDLMRAGCALRIRSCDGAFEQHLKTAGSVEGGLFHRREWQAPVSADTPDLSLWGGEAAAFLAPYRKSLHRIFESDMTRTDAVLSNGAFMVELSVDVGAVRSLDTAGVTVRETPLVEIELEWKAGPAEHIFDLALDLAQTLPLCLGWQSKAERGYELVSGRGPLPRRATPVAISAKCPQPRAVARIVGEAMSHFLANQPCLEGSGSPEAIHQTRVACRRLRAALTLFHPLLPTAEAVDFCNGFRDLALELGTVRDTDVLLTEALAPLRAAPGLPDEMRNSLRAAIAVLEIRRSEYLETARSRLADPATARLLLRLGRRLILLSQRSDDAPIKTLADADLHKRHRAFRQRGCHLAAQTATERHGLRIAAKKLRYAAEFFQSLYPDKAIRAYLKNLSELQEILGHLNDVANIPRLIAKAVGDDAKLAILSGYVMGWHLHRLRNSIADAADLHRDLNRTALFDKGRK